MRLQSIIIKGIITIVVSLPLIFSSLVFAEQWTVESLQKEIDAKGLKWKAGRTSLSDLSPEELQTMLVQKFPHTMRMMPAEERITLPDDFPTFLDWRNYKGGNWISPVKNQGMCGSCYAFGPVATMESLIKLYYNDPDLPVDLSEQYLVSCGIAGCGGFDMPDTAMAHFFYRGVPDEGCFPYNIPFPFIPAPCTRACSDAASRIQRLSSYSFIGGEGVSIPVGNEVAFIPYPENIKAVLVNKPVACVMLLNPIDWAFYTGGIYEPIGPAFAGHFIEIIGFDDTQQCWICKNSQGTNWGETTDFKPYTRGAGDGGFFRIAYVTTEDTTTFFGAFAADMNYDGGPPILTTTTTTTFCPSEELYGEGSEEVAILRRFRDTELSQTQEGKELIKLYYQWSPFVLKTMKEDEEFRITIKGMVDEILVAITEGGSDGNN